MGYTFIIFGVGAFTVGLSSKGGYLPGLSVGIGLMALGYVLKP